MLSDLLSDVTLSVVLSDLLSDVALSAVLSDLLSDVALSVVLSDLLSDDVSPFDVLSLDVLPSDGVSVLSDLSPVSVSDDVLSPVSPLLGVSVVVLSSLLSPLFVPSLGVDGVSGVSLGVSGLSVVPLSGVDGVDGLSVVPLSGVDGVDGLSVAPLSGGSGLSLESSFLSVSLVSSLVPSSVVVIESLIICPV